MQPDADTGGPGTTGMRIYPRDSQKIGDAARAAAVRLGREVPKPRILAALLRLKALHEQEFERCVDQEMGVTSCP